MTPEAKKKQDRLVRECLTMLRSANPRELLWIMEAARKELIDELKELYSGRLIAAAGFGTIPHYLDDYDLAVAPGERPCDATVAEERLARIDDEARSLRHQIGVTDSVCRLLDFMSMQSSVDDIVHAVKQGASK